jgi:hypothetical protein
VCNRLFYTTFYYTSPSNLTREELEVDDETLSLSVRILVGELEIGLHRSLCIRRTFVGVPPGSKSKFTGVKEIEV